MVSDKSSQSAGVVRLSSGLQSAYSERGISPFELINNSNDYAAFSFALDEARTSDANNGWAVTPKSAETLAEDNVTTFMHPEGGAGFGVTPDGDIVAVFKNKNSKLRKALVTMLPTALENGGVKLDCYGGKLVAQYAKFGFIPVASVEFNPEYANDGWTPDKGEPTIYFMMHNVDSPETVVKNYGKYHIPTQEELAALPHFGKDGYEDAMNLRDEELRKALGDTGADIERSSVAGEDENDGPSAFDLPSRPVEEPNAYQLRGRYKGKPRLTKSEWSLVNGELKYEIGTTDNWLDKYTKWAYISKKGYAIFAVYGIGKDGKTPTVLSAKSGVDYAEFQRRLANERDSRAVLQPNTPSPSQKQDAERTGDTVSQYAGGQRARRNEGPATQGAERVSGRGERNNNTDGMLRSGVRPGGEVSGLSTTATDQLLPGEPATDLAPADTDIIDETGGDVTDSYTRYSVADDGWEPEQTRTIIKTCFIDPRYPGELFPAKVAMNGATPFLRNVWEIADTGAIIKDENGNVKLNNQGRIEIVQGGEGTKEKRNNSDNLAWRPAIHGADRAYIDNFLAAKNKVPGGLLPYNIVFVEAEVPAGKNYMLEALEYGANENGNVVKTAITLPYLPLDGDYMYRTNPSHIVTYISEKPVRSDMSKEES